MQKNFTFQSKNVSNMRRIIQAMNRDWLNKGFSTNQIGESTDLTIASKKKISKLYECKQKHKNNPHLAGLDIIYQFEI